MGTLGTEWYVAIFAIPAVLVVLALGARFGIRRQNRAESPSRPGKIAKDDEPTDEDLAAHAAWYASQNESHERAEAEWAESLGSGSDSYDWLHDRQFHDDVQIMFNDNRASIDFFREECNAGLARATLYLSQLEKLGVVGPDQGGESREIRKTWDEWLELLNANGLQWSEDDDLYHRPPSLIATGQVRDARTVAKTPSQEIEEVGSSEPPLMGDVADHIAKLAVLLEKGLVTKKEFKEAKKRLLARL
jgi:hypothetical protein